MPRTRPWVTVMSVEPPPVTLLAVALLGVLILLAAGLAMARLRRRCSGDDDARPRHEENRSPSASIRSITSR